VRNALSGPVTAPAPPRVPEPAARAASAGPAIEVSGVTVGYDGRAALEHVSLRVDPGALVAIFGPNGGGKSTLLKVIAGVLRPWSGEVSVFGGAAGASSHRVAYVPQAELVDWSFPVSVWDVAMMGRYPRLGPFRGAGSRDRRAVQAALEQVGMAELARTQIGSLSGGQRRRAFLARALASEPDLYLLDEPVTGVDPTTQEDLMAVLDAEAAAGRTVLATTHDLAAAAEYFRRVIGVNRHVVADGPASLVLDPDVLARAYGGHLLILEGRTVLLDDAHHHDSEAGGEHHHHEADAPRRGGPR
jgi:ABC-type Mn2+/Zn2+ transport system ATPase subunit